MTSDVVCNKVCEINVSLRCQVDKKDADEAGQLRPSLSSE